MEIKYIPNLGIEINSKKIFWEDSRELTRLKLRNSHTIDDFEMDNSELFNGDHSYNIVQKRDVYENYENGQNLFFLNYNKADALTEIEFHNGIKLHIENQKIEIGEEMNSVLQKLNSHYIEIEAGNFYFKELKLNIADDIFMGGDGKELSYIYITKNELELK